MSTSQKITLRWGVIDQGWLEQIIAILLFSFARSSTASWLMCWWFECMGCHRRQDTAKTGYWAQQIYSIILRKCSMVDIVAAGNYTWTAQRQSLVFSSLDLSLDFRAEVFFSVGRKMEMVTSLKFISWLNSPKRSRSWMTVSARVQWHSVRKIGI